MKVILVRHGAQDYLKRGLIPKGIQQIKDSAKKIKSLLAMKKISPADVVLISSPLPRAEQSAGIISQLIGVELEIKDKLSSGSMWAVEIVEKCISEHSQSKVIIVISHQPQLEDILEHFAEKLCRSFKVLDEGIFKGDAIVVDLEAAEAKKI